MFGFKVSDLDDAINLSVKPPAAAGQRQKLQSLSIIEIREAIQRLLLGVRENAEEFIFLAIPDPYAYTRKCNIIIKMQPLRVIN